MGESKAGTGGEPSHLSQNDAARGRSTVLTNVPFASNPPFLVRRAQLEEARDRLLRHRRVALTTAPSRVRTQCQVEFAAELAHLCRGDFDSIWWIPCTCPAAIPGAFAEIAFPLNLPEAKSLEQERMLTAVLRQINGNSRTLVILDNITEWEPLNALFRDNAVNCVLATTGPGVADIPLTAFEITDFHPPESREFLAARLGRTLTAADEECAFHLGGIPLLLHLYAGCVAAAPSQGESLREALARFSEEHARDEKTKISQCLDYLVRTVLTVVHESEPLASSLFALAAFMGSQPLHMSAFFDGITHLPESLSQGLSDRTAFPRLLSTLSKAGVARIGSSAFAIPPLVQERFVSQLPREKRSVWCEAAVRFVSNLFPFKEEHSHFDLQCSRLIGHASVVASWAENLGCSLEETGRLLNQLGLYLRACDQHEEAIKYYLHAVACGELVDGADHPKVAVRINNLGVVYRETGRLEEARDAFRRAIRIIKDAYGPADQMLAMAMRNLVAVAEDSKDEGEMERSYRRALRIYADSLGQAHPYVHECLYSLGRIMRKHDNLDDARRCFQEALRCATLCDPVDEEVVALYSRNLGRLLLRTGDTHAAIEHLKTTVALQRKLYGPSSASLAESIYELGNAHRLEKQFPEARTCLEEALQTCRPIPGSSGLQVRIFNQLARILHAQGDLPGAVTCYRHVCRIHEEAGGAQNPELVASLTDLGDVLEKTSQLADSEACFTRALELEQSAATGHVSVGTLHYRIGAVKRARGEYEPALDAFMRAMSADTKANGGRHPDVARDLLGMGLVYRDMGDCSRAVGNLMRSLSIYEDRLGRYHAQTIEARNTLEALGNGDA